jgi:glycosyltransferase involved in cell wall biosynthesis
VWLIIYGALAVQLGILLFNLAYWRGRRLQAGASENAPTLSVLIPARNEAENLPALLESLAPQLGAGVECWVCDDGSDDGTTEWLAQHAASLGVRWFRSEAHPDGWVGKNWACHQLAARAQGEWLLFLDADMRCMAGFLDALRAYLQATDAQLVSAIPAFAPTNLSVALLKLMVPFSVFTLLPLLLAERHPNPAFAFANGQVIAFRRDEYLRWQPHQAVRGAVLEDVALAALVKRQGGLVRLLDARAWLRVSMYPTLQAAMDGFAKNAVAICRTTPMALLVGVMLALVYLYPLSAGLLLEQYAQALAAVAGALAVFGLSARVVGMPFWMGLGYPVSVVLGILTLVRSVIWYRRGWVRWKGRVYQARS